MLLLYHAAAGHEAGVRIGTHIPKLFFAISDHEMAAMLPRIPTHGAGTVRIHDIGPAGEILTPTRIEYGAATEVEDDTCRESACAIERVQACLVECRIAAYVRKGRLVRACRNKAPIRVGVIAVEATQIIGLGAGEGDLHD